MATVNELALQDAKDNFKQSVDEVTPLSLIKEYPAAAAGIAAVALLAAGSLCFPKVRKMLFAPVVLKFISSRF